MPNAVKPNSWLVLTSTPLIYCVLPTVTGKDTGRERTSIAGMN